MRRDFSGTIDRLGNDPFTVKRRADGEYINGRYERPTGADTEFPASGSVQVLRTRELELLPEAQRSKAARKVYTTCELKAGGPNVPQGKEPDHLVYEGIEYEVQGVDDWQRQGNYFKYLLVKAGQ